MTVEQIRELLIEALKEEAPSLAAVEAHEGPVGAEIEKVPLRLPAAYVVHEGSEFEAASLERLWVKARFSIYLVTRPDGPGGHAAGAGDLLKEVRGALAGRNFGFGMERLKPVGQSLVLKRESHLVHALSLETGFEDQVETVEYQGPAIKTAHVNVLEGSTVSLLSGTEDPLCPLYRLYDRNISRPFRAGSSGALEILVDQGGGKTPMPVDSIIIPPGHNLDGLTIELWHSDDGINFLEAIPQWTATESLIIKSWPSVESRYWKFIVNSSSLVPSMPELFLSSVYEWERRPMPDPDPAGDAHNLVIRSTSAGRQRFLRSGPDRRRRSYRIPLCPSSMRDEMLALWDTWGDGRPFWLFDHDGQWIFGMLENWLGLGEAMPGAYSLVFDFMEVLS